MKNILKVFSFNGEASRKEWWLVQIIVLALVVFMVQVDMSIYGEEDFGSMSLIFFLFTFWPLLATDIRRWADRGKHPLWVMINFVPVIGRLWSFIELGFIPAKKYDPWAE